MQRGNGNSPLGAAAMGEADATAAKSTSDVAAAAARELATEEGKAASGVC